MCVKASPGGDFHDVALGGGRGGVDSEGWGPRGCFWKGGWGPEGWGAQNFAFFPSRHNLLSFFSLLGVFRGILVVFEAPGPSNVHVWNSRAVTGEALHEAAMF